MKSAPIQRPFSDPINKRVEEAQWRLAADERLLIDQRHKRRPKRRRRARPTYRLLSAVVRHDKNIIRRQRHVRQIAKRCRSHVRGHADAHLPRRDCVVCTDSAAAGICAGALGEPAPHRLRLPGAARPGRVQRCASDYRDVGIVCRRRHFSRRIRPAIARCVEEGLPLRLHLQEDLIRNRINRICP